MSTLYSPSRRHDHRKHMHGTPMVEETVMFCCCRQWVVCVKIERGFRDVLVWYPVSWWNFKAKKRIKRWENTHAS